MHNVYLFKVSLLSKRSIRIAIDLQSELLLTVKSENIIHIGKTYATSALDLVEQLQYVNLPEKKKKSAVTTSSSICCISFTTNISTPQY